jgi:hypothetical protein
MPISETPTCEALTSKTPTCEAPTSKTLTYEMQTFVEPIFATLDSGAWNCEGLE